jgi:hypothetical protein
VTSTRESPSAGRLGDIGGSGRDTWMRGIGGHVESLLTFRVTVRVRDWFSDFFNSRWRGGGGSPQGLVQRLMEYDGVTRDQGSTVEEDAQVHRRAAHGPLSGAHGRKREMFNYSYVREGP